MLISYMYVCTCEYAYLNICTYLSPHVKLIYTETPCFGENKRTQKITKIPGNTLSDALPKSLYQIFAKTKPRGFFCGSHGNKWCTHSIILQERCLPVTSLRFWRNHLLESFGSATNPFLSLFLDHEGGKGHMQPLVSRVLPPACFCAWTQNLSNQLGCWQWVDDVLRFASRARILYSIHCVAALMCVQVRCCSTLDFHPK